MNYSVWGIIIIGFLLLTPSLCLITDLIIKKQHHKSDKL